MSFCLKCDGDPSTPSKHQSNCPLDPDNMRARLGSKAALERAAKIQEMNVSPTGGLRDNKGKPQLSLVPMRLISGVAEVIWKSSTKGGGKYPMHNWRKGLSYLDTAACALRHIYKWLEGEDFDQETGLHHLKHAACNIAFLLEYLEMHPELDDRYKPGGK